MVLMKEGNKEMAKKTVFDLQNIEIIGNGYDSIGFWALFDKIDKKQKKMLRKLRRTLFL